MPQKAEISGTFKIRNYFMQAQVRKQAINSWNLLVNTPFSTI